MSGAGCCVAVVAPAQENVLKDAPRTFYHNRWLSWQISGSTCNFFLHEVTRYLVTSCYRHLSPTVGVKVTCCRLVGPVAGSSQWATTDCGRTRSTPSRREATATPRSAAEVSPRRPRLPRPLTRRKAANFALVSRFAVKPLIVLADTTESCRGNTESAKPNRALARSRRPVRIRGDHRN